jgi:hypothetical protein
MRSWKRWVVKVVLKVKNFKYKWKFRFLQCSLFFVLCGKHGYAYLWIFWNFDVISKNYRPKNNTYNQCKVSMIFNDHQFLIKNNAIHGKFKIQIIIYLKCLILSNFEKKLQIVKNWRYSTFFFKNCLKAYFYQILNPKTTSTHQKVTLLNFWKKFDWDASFYKILNQNNFNSSKFESKRT